MNSIEPDRFDRFEATLDKLVVDVEKILADQQTTNRKLEEETQRWDERFFQLSRDTLNFTRNIVTTAAVVAVIVPIFRDLIPIFVEQLSRK